MAGHKEHHVINGILASQPNIPICLHHQLSSLSDKNQLLSAEDAPREAEKDLLFLGMMVVILARIDPIPTLYDHVLSSQATTYMSFVHPHTEFTGWSNKRWDRDASAVSASGPDAIIAVVVVYLVPEVINPSASTITFNNNKRPTIKTYLMPNLVKLSHIKWLSSLLSFGELFGDSTIEHDIIVSSVKTNPLVHYSSTR